MYEGDAMRSDIEIQQDVLDELEWDPSIDSVDIQATVIDGAVTLRGEVRTYAERMIAESDAQRIAGVRAVNNNLVVMPDPSQLYEDEGIAAEARRALKSNVSVPQEQVQVSVVEGRIILGGEVRWHYQRTAAENAVKDLPGVKGITNRIKVSPLHPSPADLRDRIERAFHRNADIDAAGIHIEVHDGVVTLRGVAHSRLEKAAAAGAAWAAPGVTQVRDEMVLAS
jgi:osmotically-inducible protein OsmY